ncbi:uncharacterized protein LOC142521506 [Primulina tabacum]|uniref:uncharacterized protein LOC142521506 n=1 Tax=Primulina tabacum TaxID=48773 RepID=UPI003F59384C
MARIKRTKMRAEKTPWFGYQSNHPYKGQLRLQQQSRDPQNASGSGYDDQEKEEMKGGSNSGDHELVDPSSSEKQVVNEFEKSFGDQETGAEGDEEGFGDVKAPEYQDPSSNHSLENDNGYDNSSDDRDENKRCRSQPGTSPECSESEREMETMKQENDNEYDSGLYRLKVWMGRMGLGEYVPLFKLHKVDDDEVLQFLTVEDLKEMGVP